MMPVSALLAALRSAGLPTADAAAAALAPRFVPQDLARSTPLLRQGEVWRFALVVETGLVRMHFLRRDGREFNKNFFAEGALVCPVTPAMWTGPSLFGITTIEATRIWRCDAEEFREGLAAHGQWSPLQSELLVKLLTGKLQREHDLLALDGRRRYETFCQRFPHLAARVPLVHLATYLGLTDVSLSRLRRAQRESAPVA
ncbi:Crp/Fnr family transcriptional regulator [Aquabacterium sp. A7-Y]|uniref:Crp/Fnr family transcriptional regulator n=1 Tax=Aquabacterium sp. A7-Y TaxID=1349605 RepID=UPI00223DA6E4|nr:Crp/Fnr family transcriptional regulator [Aquabacterium sp. A7-Y]MCW7540448.1 Crp/Fnr family transcriptional regulator [Aquabacterium sp. A7-Y]